jgi:hypothetical protein
MNRSIRPRRLLPVFSVILLSTLASSRAHADDKAACLAAASTGQSLRDQGKLVEAREQFRRCAAQGCPQMVVQDCGTWLSDLEKNLPTVVVTAKDGAGNDIVDVKVTLDGQPLLSKLTGESIPLDPGPHTFHFETASGTKVDRQVLVKQGDKNQEVAAVLGTPAATPAPAAPPSGAAPPPASPSSGWKTAGWVLGGLGVIGMGVGTVFGIVSMNDKNSAHCDANNYCDPGPLDSGRSAATGADVGFIAGGALLVGGLVVLLLAPSGGDATGSLHVTPLIGTSSAGASFAGSFQ